MTSTVALAQQKTRAFNRFSQAEDEVVDACVFTGIHYRNTDNVSRTLGHHVARWAFENIFNRSTISATTDTNGKGKSHAISENGVHEERWR